MRLSNEDEDRRDWFDAWVSSLPTHERYRSVLDFSVLHRFDEDHLLAWNAALMPRGVSDRDFVTLTSVNDERLTMFSKSMMGGASMIHVNDLLIETWPLVGTLREATSGPTDLKSRRRPPRIRAARRVY